CILALGQEGGATGPLAVADIDRRNEERVHELLRRCPDDPISRGIARVMRTGRAQHYSVISPEEFEPSPEDLAGARPLTLANPVSAMVVPLVARRQILGTLAFAITDSGRHDTDRDLT